jgi:phosphoribosylformimino-5-aminoimidazole carboxamide ribotide isomerase
MLIPCIDLQSGQAVQLVHGRKRELAVADVFGLLEKFKGHRWLHVIDLDAAMGKRSNDALLRELIRGASKNHGFRVRAGGGIRTVRRAAQLVELGADQVIIGSAAFRGGKPHARFLRALGAKLGRARVVVALDAVKGRIAVDGWRRSLALRPEDVMPAFEPLCSGFLCTDVDREGTMSGANLAYFRALRDATHLPVIAAGGISSHREIRALARIGMDAAVGMALYKNRLR